MEITKEQVIAKAKELGLTFSDEEIEKFVKDQKLPEKESDEPPKDFDAKTAWEMIKELRKENAERRITEKKAKEKLTDYEKQKEKEKTKALEEQGEFKKLYDELKAKSDSDALIVEQYNNYQKTKRESIKKTLGDKWIDSFNTIPLTELEALAGKINPDDNVNVHSNNHRKQHQQQSQEQKTLIKYKENH